MNEPVSREVIAMAEKPMSMEQQIREAAKASGADPDEVMAGIDRALSKAMSNPPCHGPADDSVFHVGFDGTGGEAVYHHGDFDGCPRCQVAPPRCREADFPGLSDMARCVLHRGHDGMCDIQAVPVARDHSGTGLLVLTLLVLGLGLGFALGVCAATSFGW